MNTKSILPQFRARTLFIVSVFVLLTWYVLGDAYISTLTSNFNPFIISLVVVAFVAFSVVRSKNKPINSSQLPKNIYLGFGVLIVLSVFRAFSLQVYLISDSTYIARQFIDIGGVLISILALFISWIIIEIT